MRRRFFVDEIEAGNAWLRGEQAAHVGKVLRAQAGQEYELVHGGRIYRGRVAEVGADAVRMEVLAEADAPPPMRRIELAAALFKFDRLEWMVEKATELGVARIQPLITHRTTAALASAAPGRLERWRRIALASAQQARRADVPEIASPLALSAWLPRAEGLRLVLSEGGGAPLAEAVADGNPAEPLGLLQGPEGGWTEAEHAAACEVGFAEVSLGPRILRCETAALAALAIATARD